MKLMKAIIPLALLIALAVIAYPLAAHCGKCAADGRKIIAQLDQNKMTLAKLIAAAEEHSKGRAISIVSELMGDDDKLMVEVYCVAGDPAKLMMCHIEGATGKVLGMKEVQEFPTTPATTAGAAAGGAANSGGGNSGGGGTISNQTMELACGVCIYKMPGVKGCPLAIMIDGKPYLVEGVTWPNHDYCDRKCHAVITGALQGDTFIATSLTPKD